MMPKRFHGLMISFVATALLGACSTAAPQPDAPVVVERPADPATPAAEVDQGAAASDHEAGPVGLVATEETPAATEPAAPEVDDRVAKEPFVLLDSPELRGERDLVIVAVGDVSQPGTQWVERTESEKEKLFDPTRHLLNGDLNVMNLENPVTEIQPSAKKKYAFTCPPPRLDWYFGAGFNMFSLANNHIADADQVGIDHTISNLATYAEKNDMPAYFAGAGTTPEEGIEPTIFTPEGKDLKVAFFSVGFSRSPNVGKFWDETLPDRIREAEKNNDLVVIASHAGKEYKHIPEADLMTRYRSWVDAGADLVIGHHPHVIQPSESYKGALIFYSLGNYVFASRTIRHRKMGAKMYGMMARIVVHDGKVHGAQLVPTWVNNSEDWKLDGEVMPNAHFAPQVLTGAFADAWFNDYTAWSEAAGVLAPDRVGDVGFIRATPPSEPVAFFF